MPDIGGIPYVESSDLVSGWPTVSQSVAQEVSDQLASKLDLAGGKILQIVRATDSTQRSTTSTTLTDVTGMSVTITPQKSDSAVLVMAVFAASTNVSSGTVALAQFQITDSSNNALSGGNLSYFGQENLSYSGVGQFYASVNLIGYSTPASTSAVSYKMRFKTRNANSTTYVRNNELTGQLYAIEVSA